MKKGLILFDLDGTLVNTVEDLNQSLNYSFAKNGFPSRSVEDTALAIGNGIFITIKRLVPADTSEEKLQQLLLDFRSHYRHHYLDHSLPYDGMVETLLELKKRGYLLAVTTNKLNEIAKDMIEHLFPNIFDYVQGDEVSLPKKPDPTIINMTIKRFDISKENVWYVGDSEVDIESARNAKIKLILADYGFHRDSGFLSYKDAIHIQKSIELLDVLK